MYIRTKDGVYEVEQSQLEDDEEVVNCDYGQIHKLEILRKSENLEELCDFILVWYGKMNEPVFVEYNSITYNVLKENNRFKENKCYGAIWTDEGLIYVAKMNENGELVLI